MFGRQSRMLVLALAGLLSAALVTGCFYILLVVLSFFVPLPGANSVILITGLIISIFTCTFVAAFRKLVGAFSA